MIYQTTVFVILTKPAKNKKYKILEFKSTILHEIRIKSTILHDIRIT